MRRAFRSLQYPRVREFFATGHRGRFGPAPVPAAAFQVRDLNSVHSET